MCESFEVILLLAELVLGSYNVTMDRNKCQRTGYLTERKPRVPGFKSLVVVIIFLMLNSVGCQEEVS